MSWRKDLKWLCALAEDMIGGAYEPVHDAPAARKELKRIQRDFRRGFRLLERMLERIHKEGR